MYIKKKGINYASLLFTNCEGCTSNTKEHRQIHEKKLLSPCALTKFCLGPDYYWLCNSKKKKYRKNDRKYPTKEKNASTPFLPISPSSASYSSSSASWYKGNKKLLTKGKKKKVGVLCEVYFASSKARANARPSYFRSIRGISGVP